MPVNRTGIFFAVYKPNHAFYQIQDFSLTYLISFVHTNASPCELFYA